MSDLTEQASEALNKHRNEIMAIPGVQGIGVGRGSDYGGADRPCLVIYLDESADESQIPEKIASFPVYTIKTEGFSTKGDIS